jgi:microcystin-dependent protein
MEPFIGQLLLASFSFAPRYFAQANGQLLPIQQNVALFSLFGTYYGGDGIRTFALPDLRGRVPVHQGNNQGSNFTIGQTGGEEMHTITASETPQHNHLVQANKTATIDKPATAFPAGNGPAAFNSLGNIVTMTPNVITSAGGSLPHENRQPYLVMNWVVALQGIFPSRN